MSTSEPRSHLSRRRFLMGSAAAAGAAAALSRTVSSAPAAAAPAEGSAAPPGLIIRQRSPDNWEMPMSSLSGFRTDTERFYVRSHFVVPKLEREKFRLVVDGHVRRPLELSLDELAKLGSVTRPATLECAGNGRIFLVPKAAGLLWELGAVGTAEWTGVPLAAVLDRAEPKPGAVEVLLTGADAGNLAEGGPAGPVSFARSLPMAKAARPEVLLAHAMNGAELTPAHGAPLRAVVAGWYAMASVKWLVRITVLEQPFAGYWQTFDYAYWQRDPAGQPVLTPLSSLQTKSVVARPATGEAIPAGRPYRIFGAAWTGEDATGRAADITRVQVSTDAGGTWADARLLGEPVDRCWRLWEYTWNVPAGLRGPVTVMARAADSTGSLQPMTRDADRRNTMISHVLPVECSVS